MTSTISPKITHARYPLMHTDDGILVGDTKVVLSSSSIVSHLKTCDECVIFAITLGLEADKDLARMQVEDMAAALAIDTALNKMVEKNCGAFQNKLKREVENEGKFITDRFSPGYGDFSLEYQKAFLALSKNRDIKLTDTNLLLPSKSVTAIIGISNSQQAMRNKCEVCDKKDECDKKS